MYIKSCRLDTTRLTIGQLWTSFTYYYTWHTLTLLAHSHSHLSLHTHTHTLAHWFIPLTKHTSQDTNLILVSLELHIIPFLLKVSVAGSSSCVVPRGTCWSHWFHKEALFKSERDSNDYSGTWLKRLVVLDCYALALLWLHKWIIIRRSQVMNIGNTCHCLLEALL